MAVPATTVVVARTVTPGRELDGERWIGRLLRAVAAAPGFLRSTAHEPCAAHPDEWLVVYSFDSVTTLEAWLASPERQRLIAAGAGLFADEVREQRLADRAAADTVTLVSSVTLRPGAEAAYRSLHDEGVQAASESDGLVRAELLPAVDGVQPETASLLRWKQALAVFAGLVPVSLVATLVRTALLPHAPLLVAVVLGSAANVVLLTWFVMPPFTRRLEPWLVS